MESILGGNPREMPLFGSSGVGMGTNHGLELISPDLLNSFPRMTAMPETDSSLITEEADSGTSSSDSDLELQYQTLLNSSTPNQLLDTLLTPSFHEQTIEEPVNSDFLTVIPTARNPIDEFPLFTHPLGNDQIIEDEVRLNTPEKVRSQLDALSSQESSDEDSDEEETEDTEEDEEEHSDDYEEDEDGEEEQEQEQEQEEQPSSSPIQLSEQTHVPIDLQALAPMRPGPSGVRRSKRFLNAQVPDRKLCNPSNVVGPLKSAIKLQDSLNMIVDASTGQLHDATNYATVFNASNCQGIPLPTTSEEAVSVVVKSKRTVKNPKVAIVKAYQVKPNVDKETKPAIKVGFYSHSQYKNYCSSPSKVTKVESPRKKVKKLRWANELEW